jgi:hypothetical protein
VSVPASPVPDSRPQRAVAHGREQRQGEERRGESEGCKRCAGEEEHDRHQGADGQNKGVQQSHAQASSVPLALKGTARRRLEVVAAFTCWNYRGWVRHFLAAFRRSPGLAVVAAPQ